MMKAKNMDENNTINENNIMKRINRRIERLHNSNKKE